MTPDLWAVLIPAVAALLTAAAAWLHSQANRNRIAALERTSQNGLPGADRVAPRKE